MDSVFKSIDSKGIKEVIRLLDGTYVSLNKGATIGTHMKLNSALAVVLSGEIKVIRYSENGSRMVFNQLRENDLFSIKLNPDLLNYELQCDSDVRLVVLETKRIAEIKDNSSDFQQFLKNYTSILTQMLQSNNARINILTNKTIREKLLSYFKTQAVNSRSLRFELPFTLSVLADYLAVDRSAMNRELRHLKDEGIIRIKRREVTLLLKDGVSIDRSI